MSDGDLRNIFKSRLFAAHWQPIESWSTGQGVPDAEYCFPGGLSGWIEHKKTTAFAVDFQPHQVGWIERRLRAGGRVFVAVRRVASAGPRKGRAVDELHLFGGLSARSLSENGIGETESIGSWGGGPSAWDWYRIAAILTGTPC